MAGFMEVLVTALVVVEYHICSYIHMSCGITVFVDSLDGFEDGFEKKSLLGYFYVEFYHLPEGKISKSTKTDRTISHQMYRIGSQTFQIQETRNESLKDKK